MATFTINSQSIPLPQSLILSVSNSDDMQILLSQENYEINWGDGNIETFTTLDLGTKLHNYSPNYTGDIIITLTDTNKNIGDITLLSESGTNFNKNDWSFNTTAITNLLMLNTLNSRSNTITGDVINLPESIKNLFLTGNNNVSGLFSNLPNNLEEVTLGGQNSLTGVLLDLPRGITQASLFSNSMILTGDVINLPPNIDTFDCTSNNTEFSGDINNIPKSVIRFTIGKHNLEGDISNLPPNIITFLLNFNSFNTPTTTITGDVINLPSSLTSIRILNNNLITGDIADLPNNCKVELGNLNTVTGDLSSLIDTFVDYTNLGTATKPKYTYISKSWVGQTIRELEITKADLTTAEIDQLIIDLDNTATLISSSIIKISSVTRSAVSDTAYNSLISKSSSTNIIIT